MRDSEAAAPKVYAKRRGFHDTEKQFFDSTVSAFSNDVLNCIHLKGYQKLVSTVAARIHIYRYVLEWLLKASLSLLRFAQTAVLPLT